MASNIIPFNSGSDVPAHLAALFGDDSNIAARISIDQLSYRGKVWRRIVDGEETTLTKVDSEGETVPVPVVSLIVLDHNKGRSRAFYKGSYEEGKNAAPDCYSGDGVKPDASVKEPCAATCATCPNSVKGSKITENDKQTTACSPFKRIAVVPTGAVGTHAAMLLRLAQTSVWDKNNNENEAKGWYAWDQYLDMLRARGAKHTAAVETKVKFDTRMAYPKLLFSASRWLNPEEAAAAKARLTESVDVIATILSGDGGKDGLAGQPAALPAVADDDEDDVDTEALEAAKNKAALVAAQAEVAAAKVKAAAKAAKVKAAQDAAAAAIAAAEADDEDEGDGFSAPATPAPAAKKAVVKPAPAAKAPAAAASTPVEATAVVEGTPSGLTDLLAGWDA